MKHDYDDPYNFLALYLISTSRPYDIERILTDKKYIFRLLDKEVRQLDLGGPFIDCVTEEILVNKKRMQLMHKLDSLAGFYFEQLDIDRLRTTIVKYLNEYGFFGKED